MRLLLLSLSVSIILAACSKEKPPAENTPPAVTSAPPAAPATGTAPAPAEAVVDSTLFEKTVGKVFAGNIVKEVRTKGSLGAIVFTEPGGDKTYYATDDRINRIFAIESMKLFRDIPDLGALQMIIQYNRIEQQVEVTRAEAEKFYKVTFAGMSEADWQQFVEKQDNPDSRKSFTKAFNGRRTVL